MNEPESKSKYVRLAGIVFDRIIDSTRQLRDCLRYIRLDPLQKNLFLAYHD